MNQPTETTATREMIHARIVEWLSRETQQSVSQVGYDDSLFELGIDSLGAASIAAELERRTNKTMNPEIVFELETINELAEYLDSLPVNRAGEKKAAASAPQPVAGSAPADPRAHYRRLNRRVNTLKSQGLYFYEPVISAHDGAWVEVNGQRMLMLGSYEYLGLLGHPHLKQTAIEAIEQFGTGHHGVRLLAGTTTFHRRLEAKLANFMDTQDAIVYSSGYVTNLATISALVGPGDCVIGDQWNHASIADGCRMSGAHFAEFRHNDMQSLADELQKTAGHRTLVVVDSVFSMDGDIVDMPRVVELCRSHNALLMVDEAHSLGVLGKTGRGVQEYFDLDPRDIDIKMGTLSKTFAGCGGFVAADEEIVTFLRHHARGYIFSGALPAGQASVAIAALEVLEREPELVERLWRNVHHFLSGLKELGFDTANSITPIVPVMTRTEAITLQMTKTCRDAGLLVIPVAYPAVPMDAPRLRCCVSAIHTSEDIDFALETLGRAGREAGLLG